MFTDFVGFVFLLFETNRYERVNLLVPPMSDAEIGKAEHLKVLLVEWMRRMNGDKGYYSSNRYNNYQGRGDLVEVSTRRTWRQIPYWQSDRAVQFAEPSRLENGWYRRNEFFYMGRTSPGILVIHPVTITGPSQNLFTVSLTRKTHVPQFAHVRVTISLVSPVNVDMDAVEAYMNIRTNVGNRTVRLSGRV